MLKTAGGSTGSTYWYAPNGTLSDEASVSLPSGVIQRDLYLNGQLVTQAGFASRPSYFVLPDQIGSSRVTIDFRWNPSTGQYPPTDTNYFPFGGYVTQPTDQLEQRFTGKERDAESGNDYFKYRYYASSMGRWLSPDPSMFTHVDFENPQSLNLYNYVGNRPLTLTDLDGLCWKGFQWACNIVQRFENRFSGFGFQTDDQILKHPNQRSQKKIQENRRQETFQNNLSKQPYKPFDLQLDPNAPPPPRLVVRAAPTPKKPEPPGWYECLTVPGDATAAYRDSMAAYNNAARGSSAPSDDDTSANGVGGGPVLLNLTGKGWAPQGDADAATKVNGAAAAADYVVSAGGCFAQ